MTTSQHATAHLNDGTAYPVMAYRLDLDGYRARIGSLPPAMFTSGEAMHEWLFDMEHTHKIVIREERINGLDPQKAVLLASKPGASMHYGCVWVRADWSDYRQAMTHQLRGLGVQVDPMKTLDADHVINLKRVLANHKEAWLMLMPVPSGANRGFGAAIEKNLPEITGDASSHPMEPLLLLKSFAVSAIKTEADLVELTRQIIGQLEKDAKVDEIVELAVAAYRELRRKLS